MILLSKNQTLEKISDVWFFTDYSKASLYIFQVFADREILRAVAFAALTSGTFDSRPAADNFSRLHQKRVLFFGKRGKVQHFGRENLSLQQKRAGLFGFLFLRSLRRAKNPVFTRRHMKRPVKQLIKMGHIGKAALSGDFGDRKLTFP